MGHICQHQRGGCIHGSFTVQRLLTLYNISYEVDLLKTAMAEKRHPYAHLNN